MGYEDLKELFYYDETSASCLRWKVDVFTGKGRGRRLVTAGDEAGTRQLRYWVVGVGGKQYKAHLIIMALHNVEVAAGFVVDHKDGRNHENRFSNMRVILKRHNSRNRTKGLNNTSGFTGVSWDLNSTSTNAMAAWRNLEGKKVVKRFPVDVYGLLPAFNLACNYRTSMIESLNSMGAGYTDRHGK